MHLTVVRHGETVENRKGIVQGQLPGKLTDLGERQAEQAAEELKDRDFQVIYSSDLLRCMATATTIRRHHPDTPLVAEPLLREKHFGVYQGQTRPPIAWDEYEGGANYSRRLPGGGESFADLGGRIARFLNVTFSKHEGEDILAVTHGGPMRFFEYILGQQSPGLSFYAIPNCAVSEYEVREPVDESMANL